MDQLHSAPNPAETFQAAVQAFNARQWAQAEALCRQALVDNPGSAPALNLLGLALFEMGCLDEAIASLRDAVTQQPADPYLWSNLGDVYCKAGRFSDAVECQRRAIAINEGVPEAHYNLSLALHRLGQNEQAIAAARRATELRPGYVKAHYNLGSLLREEGRVEEALAAYQAALRLRPDWAEAQLGSAIALHELGRFDDALRHFQEVLRLQPGRPNVDHLMGRALFSSGRVSEAKAAFERAAAGSDRGALLRNPLNVLFRETLAEVIAPDRAYIAGYKSRVEAALKAFTAAPAQVDLSDLHNQGATPSPMLTYYGGNVRPIVEQYARALGPLIPRLPLERRRGKPRLGIVVTAGHEGIFARCWGGIAERLSRDLFDVTLVCSRAAAHLLRKLLDIPEREYLRLPVAVDKAARLLAQQGFDWLHYWEIGTDAMNYYLPFFRPAGGQSTCWGWPVTSGNPGVDAYLSCEQVEPPDGPSHYTERLVLLKSLPAYFHRPAEFRRLPRSHFGLEDNRRVYVCAQNLRKYHPDFDPLLADLLRSDPEGLLLVCEDTQRNITNLLLDRFRRTMPDVMSRVRMLPRMSGAEYLALMAVSDVALDTLHFGAGVTAYDGAAIGVPLITMPGEFHRTRWAAAFNRRLGVPQLIAATPREYVDKAIEVASNSDLRESIQRQILEAGAELFEDGSVVREHNEYFSQAIAATRAG